MNSGDFIIILNKGINSPCPKDSFSLCLSSCLTSFWSFKHHGGALRAISSGVESQNCQVEFTEGVQARNHPSFLVSYKCQEVFLWVMPLPIQQASCFPPADLRGDWDFYNKSCCVGMSTTMNSLTFPKMRDCNLGLI